MILPFLFHFISYGLIPMNPNLGDANLDDLGGGELA